MLSYLFIWNKYLLAIIGNAYGAIYKIQKVKYANENSYITINNGEFIFDEQKFAKNGGIDVYYGEKAEPERFTSSDIVYFEEKINKASHKMSVHLPSGKATIGNGQDANYSIQKVKYVNENSYVTVNEGFFVFDKQKFIDCGGIDVYYANKTEPERFTSSDIVYVDETANHKIHVATDSKNAFIAGNLTQYDIISLKYVNTNEKIETNDGMNHNFFVFDKEAFTTKGGIIAEYKYMKSDTIFTKTFTLADVVYDKVKDTSMHKIQVDSTNNEACIILSEKTKANISLLVYEKSGVDITITDNTFIFDLSMFEMHGGIKATYTDPSDGTTYQKVFETSDLVTVKS